MALNLFGEEVAEELQQGKPGSLRERFLEPPFSILNTQSIGWQERKRMWRNLGIESELGRDGALAFGPMRWDRYSKKKTDNTEGTSIFDPVLCEILYAWFCPAGGAVLDPFAGGSVRGVVACYKGLNYTGIDLSERQVQHNEGQAQRILAEQGLEVPRWYVGDSEEVLALQEDECVAHEDAYDMIFTCPPYHDLEQYSKDPRDLSAITYREFVAKYSRIIGNALQWLRPERFAAVVIADVRDKGTGNYKALTCQTIQAFAAHGAAYYNRIIIANAIGSARLRATRQFSAARKVVTVHQDVLVFYKGTEARTAIRKLFPQPCDDEGGEQ